MRVEAFMDYLFYLMAAAGVLLFVWMVLTRYIGVRPPDLRRTIAIMSYMDEAWTVFPGIALFGWVLTVVLLVMFLLGLLFGLLVVDTPPVADAVKAMMSARTRLAAYAVKMLYSLPVNLLASAWEMCSAFLSALSFPFIVIATYLVNRWKDGTGHTKGDVAGNLYKMLLAGCIIGVLATALNTWNIALMDKMLNGDVKARIVALMGVATSSVSYLFLLLAATLGEGMFLVTVFGLIKGKVMSPKVAYEAALGSLKALYLFNFAYFALPVVVSYSVNYLSMSDGGMSRTPLLLFMVRAGITGNGYIDFVVTLIRTVFFLTPFIIVKDGLDLGEGVRRNIRTAFAAPVEYLGIFIVLGILSWLGAGILRAVSQFVVLPLTLNYYAWNVCYYVLPKLLNIWLSLFAFCVFAVFAKQKFLYGGDSPQQAV